MPLPTSSAAVVASGMIQPNGSVARPSTVAVKENQNTMAEVRSSWTSLRMKSCANAAISAPPKATTAPSIRKGSPAVPACSCGDSTISTPVSPTPTIDRRNRRTSSPRNIAAKITTSRGEA